MSVLDSVRVSADTSAATLYENVYLFFPSAFAHITFGASQSSNPHKGEPIACPP
jgi:hypothetical protein